MLEDRLTPSGTPAALEFLQQPPAQVYAMQIIQPAIQVAIVDSAGNIVTAANDPVGLYDRQASGLLGGTYIVNAVAGIATFDNVYVPNAVANDVLSAGDLNPTYFGSAALSDPLNVLPVPTATTLSATPNPAVAGQPLTLTATITPLVSPLVFGPVGPVEFFVNGTLQVTMGPNANGQAIWTSSNLPVGSDAVSAVFQGNLNWLGSTGTATVVVNPSANTPPTLVNPGNQTNAEGDSVSLQLQGSDSDGDTISYSANGLPAGLGISPSTGLISGTITAPPANYSATVTVTDSAGLSASQSFTWTVTPGTATHLQLTAPTSVTAGDTFDITVTALDAYENVATGYTGTVQFSSTDTAPNVQLPADYQFQPGDQGTHTFTMVVLQTAGNQTITVQDQANNLVAQAQVAVSGGLTAFYYNNPDWSGNPAVQRVDATVNFTYIQPNGQATNDLPGALTASQAQAGQPHAPFSVAWNGNLNVATAGSYTFYISYDAGFALWIDGNRLAPGTLKQFSGTFRNRVPVNLAAGLHSIVMVYYEDGAGPAFVTLGWQSLNAGVKSQVIPSSDLTPTALTVGFWKDIATARISLDNVPILAQGPYADIARNVRITAAYAELAQANPKAFVWAGAASIASYKVGTTLRALSSQILADLKAGETLQAEILKRAFTDLANGNQAVYNELFWQHLAFNYGGVALIKKYAGLGYVTPAQLTAR